MSSDASQRRAVGSRDTGVPARLLAAAQEVIAECGAAAATSRAITQRAGENLAYSPTCSSSIPPTSPPTSSA